MPIGPDAELGAQGAEIASKTRLQDLEIGYHRGLLLIPKLIQAPKKNRRLLALEVQ